MQKVLDFIFQEKVIFPVIIIAVALILVKILKFIVKKIFSKTEKNYIGKKRTTIMELVGNVLKFFVYAIAIMMILEVYGVDTKGILASLGIAGVVLGLALQDTVEDLMSGISIILDNYYVIGDTIRINDFTGEVIELSLKSTRVKGANGEIYIFANHLVDSVVNLSQARAGIKIDVPTAYEENTEKVETILRKIVDEVKKIPDVYDDSEYLGVDALDTSAVNYSLMIYCKSTEQYKIKRIVLKMIKEIYDRENIKIPYNQIEVHNGKEII